MSCCWPCWHQSGRRVLTWRPRRLCEPHVLKVAPCGACCAAGVATERAKFMDLVRQQISSLQDTHGRESTTLTFTGGSLQAVRPEDTLDTVRRGVDWWLSSEQWCR